MSNNPTNGGDGDNNDEEHQRIKAIVNDYLGKVTLSPDDFPGAHFKFVQQIGRVEKSRCIAITLLIEWCVDVAALEISEERAPIIGKTLQQLFVRYHGLSPTSPYGPFLFNSLKTSLEESIKQSWTAVLCVVNLCLTTCELILGHDPTILDDCVEMLKKSVEFGETWSNSSSSSQDEAEMILCSSFKIIGHFEHLLSTSVKGNVAIDAIFNQVRTSMSKRELKPGKMMDSAMTMLEHRAIREHVDRIDCTKLQNNEVMDEEAEKDYEEFENNQRKKSNFYKM